MGLNLDVDHVAFASIRKFDGHNFRSLTPAELGQVAGRAGRYMNDGTFGVTGDVEPLEADLVERLEQHAFDAVRTLQWRNRELDFRSLDRLRDSLREAPREVRLQRARMADDVMALETVSAVPEIAEQAAGRDSVEKLWDVCQVPDYRKISTQSHAELVATLYGFLMSPGGRIPEDWFIKQVALADRTDGDIDTLANRIAHIRTWTFVSNRAAWLADPEHWQGRTRAIEDSLSDALHEQLAQRFVDRKTSALMKGLRDKDELAAEIGADGAINVENHFVGRLKGFRFFPDAQADAQGVHGKASRSAAAHVLAKEFAMRARRVAAAKTDAFKLSRNMRVLWRDEEVGQLSPGDDPLKPAVLLLADEHLAGPDREKVQARLDAWIGECIGERLKPLTELRAAEDVTGLAKGIAFRMAENLGILKREAVNEEMRQLDQPARAQLRKYGVRFGAFNIYLPPLLKPAAAELTLALWALKNAAAAGLSPEALPAPPRAGLTSAPTDPATPEAFYRAAGYHLCGPRAIRIDILERLADQIRPLLAWRAKEPGDTPPKGSSGDGGFIVTPEMMSILGCSSDELANVLKTLGFRLDRKPMPASAAAPPQAVAADPTPAAAPAIEYAASAPAGDVPVPAADAAAASAEVPDGAPPPASPGEAAVAAALALAAADAAAAAPPADSVATAGAGAAVPAAGEPRLIDIWRPRRRDRPDRRERHERQGQGRGEAQGEDRRKHGVRWQRRSRPPRDQKPEVAAGEAAQAAASAPASEDKPEERRDDRHNHRGPRQGQQERRGGERGERREDRSRRDGDRLRPEMRSASPPRPKGIDPDSPFAALGALRQQLEKQAREKSS
jgi:ATP-dependent RNA helicase SUPV3L1/SUV3